MVKGELDMKQKENIKYFEKQITINQLINVLNKALDEHGDLNIRQSLTIDGNCFPVYSSRIDVYENIKMKKKYCVIHHNVVLSI